jgi:hypothetical protein
MPSRRPPPYGLSRSTRLININAATPSMSRFRDSAFPLTRRHAARHDATPRGTTRLHAARRDPTRHDATPRGTTRRHATPRGTGRRHAARRDATPRHAAARRHATWHDATPRVDRGGADADPTDREHVAQVVRELGAGADDLPEAGVDRRLEQRRELEAILTSSRRRRTATSEASVFESDRIIDEAGQPVHARSEPIPISCRLPRRMKPHQRLSIRSSSQDRRRLLDASGPRLHLFAVTTRSLPLDALVSAPAAPWARTHVASQRTRARTPSRRCCGLAQRPATAHVLALPRLPVPLRHHGLLHAPITPRRVPADLIRRVRVHTCQPNIVPRDSSLQALPDRSHPTWRTNMRNQSRTLSRRDLADHDVSIGPDRP